MNNLSTPVESFTPPEIERYRLVVLRSEDASPRLQVFDCERGCQMFDWHGYAARYLINEGGLDSIDTRHCGCYPCNKHLVSRLALAAATSQSMYSKLPDVHRCIARVLTARSSEHLTARDVREGILAVSRMESTSDVDQCLSDLVDWHLLQRIVIDEHNVFYDLNTRPHEHVFDPETRRISDA